MKDELNDVENQVLMKFPRLGRTGCLAILATVVFVIFVLGLGIGYGVKGSQGKGTSSGNPFQGASSIEQASPSYVFLSNNSGSCPPLVGENLLTTVAHGQSFEGLVVNMACKGNNIPFPTQVKCKRKSAFEDSSSLEWSHLPVCYPNMLIGKAHWEVTPNARSVSCTGDSGSTSCQLACIRNYIAVEASPYKCGKMPCPKWTLQDSKCYMCDKKCDQMHSLKDPKAEDLVSKALQCTCPQVIVSSEGKAAIWQNKRTGLFSFAGEHNGRPLYRNQATKEYLFYTLSGSEWLVGPDFRKNNAGIQMHGNDNTQCPEFHGGQNVSKLYIDSSQPSEQGTGKWTTDETLSFKCVTDEFKPVKCNCKKYKVFNTVYGEDEETPNAINYLVGEYALDVSQGNDKGLMAPLYVNAEKDLYLFSHHPMGLVWQVSTKLSMTPLRGIFDDASKVGQACPDKESIRWQWFNSTTPNGQQVYIEDDNIHVKCVERIRN